MDDISDVSVPEVCLGVHGGRHLVGDAAVQQDEHLLRLGVLVQTLLTGKVDRVVGQEETGVTLQLNQVEPGEEGVGDRGVDNIYLTAVDGGIAHRYIQSIDPVELSMEGGLQAGRGILPLDEVDGTAQTELKCYGHQIGEDFELVLLGDPRLDTHGISAIVTQGGGGGGVVAVPHSFRQDPMDFIGIGI